MCERRLANRAMTGRRRIRARALATIAALTAAAIVALSPVGPTARAASPADDALPTLACQQLRRASLPLSPFYSERLIALRLMLDGGLQGAIGMLRPQVGEGTPPVRTAETLHALRVWRTQIQGVLRRVAEGREPRLVLAEAEPALSASAATVASLLPDADGSPCVLAAEGGVLSPAGPLRAAVLYEGVLVALSDRSSEARIRSRAPAAARLLGRLTTQLSRLRARFPNLAAGGRSLLPTMRAAVRAAVHGQPAEVAAGVRRLGGVQPFLMGALASRDLAPPPVPSPPPGPGEPSLVLPRVRGMAVGAAFGRLCRLGLAPLAHATIIGERPAGTRTGPPPVRVLGTDPAAGAAVSLGARVTLRLGVLQGISIALPAACP